MMMRIVGDFGSYPVGHHHGPGQIILPAFAAAAAAIVFVGVTNIVIVNDWGLALLRYATATAIAIAITRLGGTRRVFLHSVVMIIECIQKLVQLGERY